MYSDVSSVQLLPGFSCLPNNPTSCVLIPTSQKQNQNKQINSMAKMQTKQKKIIKTKKNGKLKWLSPHQKIKLILS